MFDLILARGWQAIHSLLHSPTRFQRAPATNMPNSLFWSLYDYSNDCAKRNKHACDKISLAIHDACYTLIRRHGSAAAASLGEDGVAALGDPLPALGGGLIEESHRFPYVYVGLFGAVVAFVAFYVGRRTRNDAYYSV